MKKSLSLLLILLSFAGSMAYAQPATVSYPFSVGRSGTCNSGSAEIHFYTYNGVTNFIGDASGGLLSPCVPNLRIGLPANGTQRFTQNLASISFNPKDHNIYYFWTAYPPSTLAPGGVARTYAWRYPVGTCPGTNNNKLDTLRSFKADLLGVAFDNSGNGYMLEFSGEPDGQPHKMWMRSIDFATGVMGNADTLATTAGAKVYKTQSGDIAISPSGQMFFVVDNKLFTPDHHAYTGTNSNITCTYIDTVKTSNSFVGLTYAEGEAIAGYSGSCSYEEIKLLTAANTPITESGGGVKATSDMATVVSGLGVAKKLYSVVPTGTANQYDVEYDIFVQNYGNMDIANVQVTDDLKSINGNANVQFTSVAFVSNPAGMVLNAAYNGKTNINLLNGTGTLVNYPVANNNFTIRIKCRLSGILNGIIYYNSAIGTARDFNNNNLRDSSTNGPAPDLNNNDKPDDVGEGQPTPLLISITPQTPPCSSLTNILYSQDFGTGTGLVTAVPAPVVATGVTVPTRTSQFTGVTTQPVPIDGYTLSENAQSGNTAQWVSLTDHTGNANGRMLLLNADVNSKIFYKGDFLYGLCPNQQYSVSFYAAFIGNGSFQTLCNGFGGFKYPKIRVRVRDYVSDAIIAEVSTGDIFSTSWQQLGLKFVAPASYSGIKIELLNDAPGGCGNDLAIDDIQFGTCDPLPAINAVAAAGCIGTSTTLTSALSDPAALPGTKEYQWQVAPAATGPWTDISGATTANFTIASVVAADVNKYYRVIVAANGNMAIATCRYTSPGVFLTAKTLSSAATSASRNKNNICPGVPVTLGITGGSLGTNATWKWFSGSCTGTPVGTGATLTVTPSVSTTYYVLAEGDCNTTTCQQVTVSISCDIDKDKDGIPDFVESYIPAALANAYNTSYAAYKDNNNNFINDDFEPDADSDSDGTLNYRDTDFPGRIDSNGDGVDDRFDFDLDGIINMLDLDSDNDGIPDVVEAGGVDTDGNGKIDSFSDTDGDGLSQNVDQSNAGVPSSGVGLGAFDADGDGFPNAIDLDSDNDGIPDVVEAGGAYVNTNNNGFIANFTDVNLDGISDNVINANALIKTGADMNADGRADSYPFRNMDGDSRANPYDLDSDGDGITDVLEAGFTDGNLNGIIDGAIGAKGWSTVVDGLATFSIRNTDTRGNADYLDIDSDDDGIPDNIEGQTTASYKFASAIDADKDGIDDIYDVISGWGGSGIFLSDKDVDGIPDYRDLDTDSDGAPDIAEGNDFNLNGLGDDIVTLTLLDTDGDGLDNRFDSLTSITNVKGTSYNMGTGGSNLGDAAPGARCTVQKTSPAQPDRDWRYTSYVLNVKQLQLSGVSANDNVRLAWNIITTMEVGRFELERSTDNIHFSRIQSLVKNVVPDQLQSYNTDDDIANVSSDYIFYRMKAISKNGQASYSNVLVIKKSIIKTVTVTMHPNPASEYITIRFYSASDYEGSVKLIDNLGKIVLLQKQKIAKGNNSIALTGLSKFSDATYSLQLILQDQVITQKLIISNR